MLECSQVESNCHFGISFDNNKETRHSAAQFLSFIKDTTLLRIDWLSSTRCTHPRHANFSRATY